MPAAKKGATMEAPISEQIASDLDAARIIKTRAAEEAAQFEERARRLATEKTQRETEQMRAWVAEQLTTMRALFAGVTALRVQAIEAYAEGQVGRSHDLWQAWRLAGQRADLRWGRVREVGDKVGVAVPAGRSTATRGVGSTLETWDQFERGCYAKAKAAAQSAALTEVAEELRDRLGLANVGEVAALTEPVAMFRFVRTNRQPYSGEPTTVPAPGRHSVHLGEGELAFVQAGEDGTAAAWTREVATALRGDDRVFEVGSETDTQYLALVAKGLAG